MSNKRKRRLSLQDQIEMDAQKHSDNYLLTLLEEHAKSTLLPSIEEQKKAELNGSSDERLQREIDKEFESYLKPLRYKHSVAVLTQISMRTYGRSDDELLSDMEVVDYGNTFDRRAVIVNADDGLPQTMLTKGIIHAGGTDYSKTAVESIFSTLDKIRLLNRVKSGATPNAVMVYVFDEFFDIIADYNEERRRRIEKGYKYFGLFSDQKVLGNKVKSRLGIMAALLMTFTIGLYPSDKAFAITNFESPRFAITVSQGETDFTHQKYSAPLKDMGVRALAFEQFGSDGNVKSIGDVQITYGQDDDYQDEVGGDFQFVGKGVQVVYNQDWVVADVSSEAQESDRLLYGTRNRNKIGGGLETIDLSFQQAVVAAAFNELAYAPKKSIGDVQITYGQDDDYQDEVGGDFQFVGKGVQVVYNQDWVVADVSSEAQESDRLLYGTRNRNKIGGGLETIDLSFQQAVVAAAFNELAYAPNQVAGNLKLGAGSFDAMDIGAANFATRYYSR